jgi:hypothetical protein
VTPSRKNRCNGKAALPSFCIVELCVTVYIEILKVPLLATKPKVLGLYELPETVVPIQQIFGISQEIFIKAPNIKFHS